MSDLAPCPFCGASNARMSTRDDGMWFVMCFSCTAEGPTMEGAQAKLEAANEWNRRAPAEQPSMSELVATHQVPQAKRMAELCAEQPSTPVPRMGGNTKCLTDKQMATIERAARVSENSGHPRLADSLRGILARIVGQQTKGEAS